MQNRNNILNRYASRKELVEQEKHIRVLHVIESMDPKMGGISQAVFTIVSGLSDYGVDNEVVSLDSIAATNEVNVQFSFPVHRLGEGIGPWSYNPNLVPWLAANLSRFDFVISHGIWLYHSHAVKKAVALFRKSMYYNPGANSNKLRLLVMPHGMLDPYFQKAKSRKLKAIRNLIYWKLFERKVINSADAILFTCEQERCLAREPFNPYHPKKEIVVGLGVENPPMFENRMNEIFLEKCPELANQRYLLFLSRIHEKKGVDLLVKAYTELIELFPDFKDIKLVIAGPGLDSSYGVMIKELVSNSRSITGQVFFPGMLSGHAKWGAFYGCDAFVLPSHQENFGIAVVEAMACGKPVLISNQVNIWKEVVSLGGGIVNNDSLEGTLCLLKAWYVLSSEDQVRMGRGARATYEKSYATEPATKCLMKALDI